MGIHAVATLLLLYKSLFLPVLLYNAQAWSNLTKSETQDLQRVQLKFLKRSMHAPSSTSNPRTFLETGILPISYEIHVKQLSFLQHIVTLESSDPVLKSYRQQLQYPEAPNWVNQVAQLRSIYNISEEVAKLSKKVWKEKIKKQVRNRALLGLNNELKNQKKAQSLPPYHNLVSQDYITTLSPRIARKVFHIRTGTIDLRTVRTFPAGCVSKKKKLSNMLSTDVLKSNDLPLPTLRTCSLRTVTS